MVKKHYNVIWSNDAKSALRSIYNYIKKRESVEQAKRVRDEIGNLAKSLGFMPHKYNEDPFLKEESGDNRFKVIWSYKLVYEVAKEEIIILDVFHTSRDPQNLKKLK